ncbi:glutathione S-transferase family protein [Agrobacterium sp. B1(2019)]|uniref:glutathione S-transferase family protein n=1 Tax=Agrobacterium sp. B1(2019) TaxID=2607032 RepID=UPI0011ED8D2D|nr:glutathione S-transferase family protein [Agrobacterium sp. B1(2019)]TZG36551.1 glutathione S-transferase family protein [Agrobacterium sp. B1(2019)]
MLRLYDSRLSGNSWKVRLLLSYLGTPFQRVTLDLERGDTREPSFVQKSRFSRIPVLELDDGTTIVESAAILLYLAEGSPLLPDDRLQRADVHSWMFFEQADLQKPLALSRMYRIRGQAEAKVDDMARMLTEGTRALEKLDRCLDGHHWLVGENYSLADLAVFPYVSLAHEGGFDMRPFPNIARWLASVRNQPRWIDLLQDVQT